MRENESMRNASMDGVTYSIVGKGMFKCSGVGRGLGGRFEMYRWVNHVSSIMKSQGGL